MAAVEIKIKSENSFTNNSVTQGLEQALVWEHFDVAIRSISHVFQSHGLAYISTAQAPKAGESNEANHFIKDWHQVCTWMLEHKIDEIFAKDSAGLNVLDRLRNSSQCKLDKQLSQYNSQCAENQAYVFYIMNFFEAICLLLKNEVELERRKQNYKKAFELLDAVAFLKFKKDGSGNPNLYIDSPVHFSNYEPQAIRPLLVDDEHGNKLMYFLPAINALGLMYDYGLIQPVKFEPKDWAINYYVLAGVNGGYQPSIQNLIRCLGNAQNLPKYFVNTGTKEQQSKQLSAYDLIKLGMGKTSKKGKKITQELSWYDSRFKEANLNMFFVPNGKTIHPTSYRLPASYLDAGLVYLIMGMGVYKEPHLKQELTRDKKIKYLKKAYKYFARACIRSGSVSVLSEEIPGSLEWKTVQELHEKMFRIIVGMLENELKHNELKHSVTKTVSKTFWTMQLCHCLGAINEAYQAADWRSEGRTEIPSEMLDTCFKYYLRAANFPGAGMVLRAQAEAILRNNPEKWGGFVKLLKEQTGPDGSKAVDAVDAVAAAEKTMRDREAKLKAELQAVQAQLAALELEKAKLVGIQASKAGENGVSVSAAVDSGVHLSPAVMISSVAGNAAAGVVGPENTSLNVGVVASTHPSSGLRPPSPSRGEGREGKH